MVTRSITSSHIMDKIRTHLSYSAGTTIVFPPPSVAYGVARPILFHTIHSAFRYHSITQPEAIAVRHVGSVATYRSLDVDSTRLATILSTSYGIRRGSRVCLVLSRGIHMIIALLAVLKCGGAYIPIDGGITTESTLEYVVNDSSPALVLASRPFVHRPALASVLCACLDDLVGQKVDSSKVQFEVVSSHDDAYLIYTSGTTGRPKGVVVTHGNVTNLLCSIPGNLGMQPGMRVSQLLNIAFDMCAWEILGSMMNGCSLYIRGSDKPSWDSTLRSVDVVIATPSILSLYEPSEYPNIKIVAVAGEPCSLSLANRWAKCTTFYNCCGPTETTIVNTVAHHQLGRPLTVGKPTPNNSIYVLDDKMEVLPRGSPGIIWAGGAGISRGYVNLPELSSRLFKPDIFLQNGMMYNTGDWGRMRLDGEIELLGRIDNQVKVKGFRVELDGVTEVACSCPSVVSATTLLDNQMVVCIVAPETVDLEEVRRTMRVSLPYYANPGYYVVLPSLPLTPNGKIDKVKVRGLLPSN